MVSHPPNTADKACIGFTTLQKKGVFCVEENSVSDSSVKNVFKNCRMPTKEEYTKVWMDLIRQMERLKATQ